ncbi:polyunsaturated fatty acid 5-lipoxygenase-like [Cetorhinus maximus]
MITYKVTIETGEALFEGTWSYVYCTLIGERGNSHKTKVNGWFFGALGQGSVIQQEITSDQDLGTIHFVELTVSPSLIKDYWFCCSVTMENPEGNSFQFPCYKWLADCSIRLREGTAKRACDDWLPIFQSDRQDELLERQQLYRWKNEQSKIPKCIDVQSVDGLPVNLKFSCVKEFDFNFFVEKSFAELQLKEFVNKLEHSWTTIEDFDNIFWKVTNPIAVFTKKNWHKDWVFGYQFLNGFNPVLIEKCKKIPENFPVTDAMVRESLGNSTLEQEIKNGNLYMVNYEILDGIPANIIKDIQQYIAAPICLLHLNKMDHIVPIAIQLKQTPGEDNPIFLPSDSHFAWLLAKVWVRSSDFQHSELVSHLLKTHLIAESFSMATVRQLPSVHPIYKLLAPHMKYTIHINTVARSSLIGKNGYINQMFGVKEDDDHFLSSKAFQTLSYRSLCLPETMKDREVTDLKGYYYKDDALSIWSAIHDFVTKIVMYHYKNDKEVEDDFEVQAWIKELTQVGFEGIGDIEKSGFPTSFSTRMELCKFLTMIIFVCSAQHAALNNGQYDWGAWVPNSPCSMRKPPPTTKRAATMEYIMKSMPDVEQSCLQMAILWVLNHTPRVWEMSTLGDYREEYFTEDNVKKIIKEFQDELKKIDCLIQERNESLVLKYEYLRPENIENSITV